METTMPPYFYACDSKSGVIRAATGVKGFLFPESDAANAFQKFWATKDYTINSPNDVYADAIKNLVDDEDFSEEIDHFCIVEKSDIARAIFAWNVICRMAYSSSFNKAGFLCSHKVLPIHREIVRYSQALMYFFLSASPLLEESYDRRTGKGGHHSELHAPDVRAARAFLELAADVPSHSALAIAVDHAFIALWRRRRRAGLALFYESGQKPMGFGKSALSLQIFRPALTSRHAALVIARRFFQLLRSMGGNLLRLIFTGRINQKIAGLQSASAPAVLSPRGHIDPVAFAANRVQWKSLEEPAGSDRSSCLGNLLWHVLTRCTEVTCMMRANMPIEMIEKNFQALWKFYHPSFVESLEVCEVATDIDNTIIDLFRDERANSPKNLGDVGRIAAIGLDVFHRVVSGPMAEYESEGRLKDFAQAFAITYMQV